jgi:hypothetical protein
LEDERAVARAAVEDELRAHAAEVHSGHYLTVLPKTALPTLLGASNTRMAELCASTGARVEIGETAAGLVWVRIGASAPASGLAVLWTALGAAADADACGAGLPLLPLVPPGTAPSALIPPSVLQATQAASGAQIAASADVVLMSAHKGALHTALLLLLRDALGVAACTTREALLFTAFPPTLARLRQSLTELLPAAAASTCLMVEPIRTAASGCAGSEADLHDEWGARRAVMWAERAHFEAAAELVARAGRGSQTLHAVRAALPATVLSIPPPPPPPLPAWLGGQLAEAEAALVARVADGAPLRELLPMLEALGPLHATCAQQLRAAALECVRRTDTTRLPSTLAWLDAAIAAIDERLADASRADDGPKRVKPNGGFGAAPSAGAHERAAGPFLTFGLPVASVAAIAAHAPSAGLLPPTRAGTSTAVAPTAGAAAATSAVATAGESSSDSGSSSEEDDSKEERRRKHKKKRKREKREKRERKEASKHESRH